MYVLRQKRDPVESRIADGGNMSSMDKKNDVTCRKLKEDEINRSLFSEFRRRQIVTDCWRRVDGEWVIKPEPFVDEWSEENYAFLVECLKNTVCTGGIVYGAFLEGHLKGFTSVEEELFGSGKQYADLTCIHVSEELRGSGIGKKLFLLAADWARGHGAKKLYISAHSAVESQAFYRRLGCVEAEEYSREHVEREPYDCQLEYRL